MTQEDWVCKRKLRYRSKKYALMVAATVRKNRGEDVYAYKCVFCKDWHIGHPKKVSA